jgi:hypothetical protein
LGKLFRALFLVLLWLLLIGSGLCVALAAVFIMFDRSFALVSLIAAGVGIVCWFVIQALKKDDKAATPPSGPDEPS